MLQKTNGIVLRSVKYGETSLITTIFTEVYGIQGYMVQGVRSAGARQNRAAFFQPGMLLELVVYRQPQKNLQRIREYQAAYIYNALQEDVVKNSIILFSAELLLRLLPEEAQQPQLFAMAFSYFIALDKMPLHQVPNFPLYFIIQCGRILGYELTGHHAAHTPSAMPFINQDDEKALALLLSAGSVETLHTIPMNAGMRFRLIDWCLAYLQQHTQHMGNLKSLAVLRAVLH